MSSTEENFCQFASPQNLTGTVNTVINCQILKRMCFFLLLPPPTETFLQQTGREYHVADGRILIPFFTTVCFCRWFDHALWWVRPVSRLQYRQLRWKIQPTHLAWPSTSTTTQSCIPGNKNFLGSHLEIALPVSFIHWIYFWNVQGPNMWRNRILTPTAFLSLVSGDLPFHQCSVLKPQKGLQNSRLIIIVVKQKRGICVSRISSDPPEKSYEKWLIKWNAHSSFLFQNYQKLLLESTQDQRALENLITMLEEGG